MINTIKINIWGRKFLRPVMIQEFQKEKVTDLQKKALKMFEADQAGVESAKEEVEKYIQMSEAWEEGMTEVDNIFKYVMPRSVFFPQDKKRVAAILCDYKFDMENGLAVVFENEVFREVGPQDIIL